MSTVSAICPGNICPDDICPSKIFLSPKIILTKKFFGLKIILVMNIEGFGFIVDNLLQFTDNWQPPSTLLGGHGKELHLPASSSKLSEL